MKKNKYTIAASIIIVLLAAAALFATMRPKVAGEFAYIIVDSEEYMKINLTTSKNEVFSILEETGKQVSFEIKDGKIRFVNVTCPDHICERTGFVFAEGQTAACLPNRVLLVVEPD